MVDGNPSVFKLPEWKELTTLSKSTAIVLDQCRFGARAKKPTALLANRACIEDMALLCDHPRRRWTIPWNGDTYSAPHAILRGRQWAIPYEDWRPHMMRRTPPSVKLPYITGAAAHYPKSLDF